MAAVVSNSSSVAEQEIRQGRRYSFGRNWKSFLETLDESRIAIAEESLRQLLQVERLEGKSFLDVGSGSGLFSLAARRLGAKVHSFDFDPNSVECARFLRDRFFPGDPQWVIEQGSALDKDYLRSLGPFDVVYSWGVLHHTGDMWRALDDVAGCVSSDGRLAIAIYNDQGWRSRVWHAVKRCYCSGTVGRYAVCAVFIPWFFFRTIGKSLLTGRNEFSEYRRHRGMSITHDWHDWLGGLPFEVASVERIVEFHAARGFTLARLKRTRRLGCNEFLFVRESAAQAAQPEFPDQS